MSDRYSGLTGNVIEANDIAAEHGLSFGAALVIQRERAAHREQEYRDVCDAIESNVIYADFVSRTRLEK
jgi:hypothetical protein